MNKLFLLLLLGVSVQSSAHYLWIELGAPAKVSKPVEVRIYYGEYNEGVRERKGGRLEELSGTLAWVISPDGTRTALDITMDNDFFSTTFTPRQSGKYTIVAVNKVRDVVDWSKHNIGIVRPVYYAMKEINIGATPSSTVGNVSEEVTLSISPTTSPNAFTLRFKGQPLKKVAVLFHAPNGWSKELVTGQDGVVSFDPLWKGQYVVECIYLEKTPGNFNGKEYESIRHRATLAIDIL
jgi:hypothetical protein